MKDVPRFYGIQDSNTTAYDLWSRDMFPKALAVALTNYLGDRGIPLNYILARRTGVNDVGEITSQQLYRSGTVPFTDLGFDFDTVYRPHMELATGVPESDLVIRGPRGDVLSRLDILASVVPDSSTKALREELMGPEMTVRTPLLKNCALSMASSLLERKEEALEILDTGIPDGLKWGEWNVVSHHVDGIVDSLNELESAFTDTQTPMVMQFIWRTEPDGPMIEENAMDVFVWSDHAFTKLFLDSVRRSSDGGVTRPLRCAVRLYRMIKNILYSTRPDLDSVLSETQYGITGNREFMVNGKQSNRIMSCERLVRPVLSAPEIVLLASEGFEDMIMPERRLDTSIYYASKYVRW